MNKKRILITGKHSYIGSSFMKWITRWQDQYEIKVISVRGKEWENINFADFHSILHLAGIAHVTTDPKMEDYYYRINRDLTLDIAKKAKASGIKQFIFLSSIIVYGESSNKLHTINEETIPTPTNCYGKSKLQAEEGLMQLKSNHFKVAIIRSPMIYGRGSKGNYPRLAELAKRLPFFPYIENQRSMLHIDNLCELLRLIIDNVDEGLFFPQNSEYVNTSKMVMEIAKVHGKKIWLIKGFNPLIHLLSKRVRLLKKLFGNFVYESRISVYKKNYHVRSFEESIRFTEGDESGGYLIEKSVDVSIRSFND
ncbi:NAD-dependent epimerase/dehydratase family protein [Caldibacillus lycopersici]|uniref:NAD-dependent epimerase/dehydratase family protein n=1 Tax=Perspicuibacillus lycopersici TaxID=1325689 RepID=A0AAE3IQH3_9BACI|nr:NAD-dependent epimerase/dehydratase family protein [Perspicuibacillus lycopersici]MCU9612332.1 NAD-dependent epimerase/dehydratase family protein [Perspicuibacillus lycopersici]